MDDILSGDGGEWYLGICSYAIVLTGIEHTPMSIDDYLALKEHRASMEADEGVRVALKRQNMEPIG